MVRPVASTLTFLALVLTATPLHGDRAHALAKKAAKAERATCEGVDSVKTCHRDYPTGCTASQTPRYDAYLNYLKNQLPNPTSPVTQVFGPEGVKVLDGQVPDTLTRGNHAAHAEDLADLGEGNIVALLGYLYFVQVTGAESSNCQLSGPGETDFHLGIGFDGDQAQRLLEGPTLSPADLKGLQQASFVVEMTPHYRARYHPKWTKETLERVVGRQVKVVGQIMIDNAHANARDNCAHPDADLNKCWRASAWELHPVIEFYVCTGGATCAQDSPEWKRLEDLQ